MAEIPLQLPRPPVRHRPEAGLLAQEGNHSAPLLCRRQGTFGALGTVVSHTRSASSTYATPAGNRGRREVPVGVAWPVLRTGPDTGWYAYHLAEQPIRLPATSRFLRAGFL